MKASTSVLSLGLLASTVMAINMDVQQNGQWNLVTAQQGECEDFDTGVTQVNLDPSSNNQRAFRCIFYQESECQGSVTAVVASNHPLSGVFSPIALSVICLNM
ncbi:hypothetical protein ASPCAL13034 [Aspergillus calidoustus]|uniref:Uncharacterized protein n=1 Tax=Aspergillus calidoustus TaxID=454130 RepID=A0A0U5GC33_ASPCI|nr:hypothetical protein ASPCAL13034 [Aspergillus calidoustus]